MNRLESPPWWDRDIDQSGIPIRPDVRSAAHEIWHAACRRVEFCTSDCCEAAELMESAVAQVSRYLDRRGVMLFSREIHGLLMRAFQRALHRRILKLKRIDIIGGSEQLSNRAVDRTWTLQVHFRLEYEQIVRLLNERSQTVLALRYAGYTWKEAALAMGTSPSGLRTSFWRDVARVKNEINVPHPASPEHKPHREIRPES
jgi:hypothetical protein